MCRCLDYFITLEDEYCTNGFYYWVEVTTPQNLSYLMEKSEVDLPGYPYIIVSKLRTDIIKKAIQAFSDEKDQA